MKTEKTGSNSLALDCTAINQCFPKADKAAAKQKAKEEAEAAAKKAEEDKAKLLEALQTTGKSIDEVLAFMKGE